MEAFIDLVTWCQRSDVDTKASWSEMRSEGSEGVRPHVTLEGEKEGLSESVGIHYLGDEFRERN